LWGQFATAPSNNSIGHRRIRTGANRELTGLDEDPPLALTLMPGDVVNLQMISGTDSAALGLTVDERGVLHVPLAGDVDVSGLSLTEAEARIETALRPFDQTVRVTIIVAEPNGQRATVIGAVTTPGRHTVVPGMRVADLFALAGGGLSTEDEDGTTIPMSDVEGARLVRSGQVLPVSLVLAIMGDPRHNVRLRPGDHLYVPPAVHSLVSVLGEVHAARVMPFRPGLRLTLALAFAGGPTRDADHAEIIVVRGDHAAPRCTWRGSTSCWTARVRTRCSRRVTWCTWEPPGSRSCAT
jgi:protein involved in polysaccharide export with SLBB domain